jgi:hypothetical protein
MKHLPLLLIALLSSTIVFGQTKHFDRNELPQLDQDIIEASEFEFAITTVPTNSIIPVQTQRVENLKDSEKKLIEAQENSYRPLVIDESNYLIDGHHRLDALKELGIITTRVIRVEAPIEKVISAFPEYRDNSPTYEPAVE